MRRPFAVALLGLCVALGSSSLLHAQQVKPISYEDLVSRLETVESELTAMQNASPIPDQVYSGNSNGVSGGLFITYENVWIKPYFDHNTAYQTFDNLPNINEEVRVTEFEWGFRSTPRIELGYITPGSGLGWRARYWQFDSSTSIGVLDPNLRGGGPGRIEVGLHDDPDIEVSTGDNEAVQITDALKLTVVDAEMMSRHESDCSQLTFSGGLRYLRKEQNYQAIFRDVDTGIADDILTSKTFFEGVGPTLALEGVRRLGASSLSVFGKSRGSLLLGDSGLEQARIDPQDVAGPIQDFVRAENSLDFQFIAELQVGLQYERCIRNGTMLFGRLGAEVQYWPSGGSASYQNGEDSGVDEDPRDANMLLFGLSASVGTEW